MHAYFFTVQLLLIRFLNLNFLYILLLKHILHTKYVVLLEISFSSHFLTHTRETEEDQTFIHYFSTQSTLKLAYGKLPLHWLLNQ
jgi:hypothetical protein